MIDGSDGAFARILSALGEVGWRGASIRDVLEATPKFYADYREGLQCRGEAPRCREAFYKLRDEHSEQHAASNGDGIVGRR